MRCCISLHTVRIMTIQWNTIPSGYSSWRNAWSREVFPLPSSPTTTSRKTESSSDDESLILLRRKNKSVYKVFRPLPLQLQTPWDRHAKKLTMTSLESDINLVLDSFVSQHHQRILSVLDLIASEKIWTFEYKPVLLLWSVSFLFGFVKRKVQRLKHI